MNRSIIFLALMFTIFASNCRGISLGRSDGGALVTDLAPYLVVLAEARTIVARVWGTSDNWATFCGIEHTGEKLSLTLYQSLLPLMAMKEEGPIRFSREFSDQDITEFIHRGFIDRACKGGTTEGPCRDKSFSMTVILSEATPAPEGRLHIAFFMFGAPACPNGEEQHGFVAELLFTLRGEGGNWIIDNVEMRSIT